MLSIALVTLSGVSALQHVHAYGGHDHPEHHHGLAAHAHKTSVHVHHDAADMAVPQLEGCDAGEHAVSAAFTYVPAHQVQTLAPVADVVALFVPPVTVVGRTPAVDRRAHSPPGTADTPLRAPPLVVPA